MLPALERLIDLMPPPSDLPASPPWQDAPAQVGFQFPADYRAFIDRYGAGEVNGHLIVLAPTERPYLPGLPPGFAGYTAFAEQDIGQAFTELRASDPAHYPYPIFPEPGGLLLWARTYDGDHLFWDTEHSAPDQWPVVLWLRHEPPPAWHPFPGTATDFLLSLATRTHPYADVLTGAGLQPPQWVRTEDWKHEFGPPSDDEA
ncbi:SMI1/KNR4 family protein [Streptomyces sp. NPDC002920]